MDTHTSTAYTCTHHLCLAHKKPTSSAICSTCGNPNSLEMLSFLTNDQGPACYSCGNPAITISDRQYCDSCNLDLGPAPIDSIPVRQAITDDGISSILRVVDTFTYGARRSSVRQHPVQTATMAMSVLFDAVGRRKVVVTKDMSRLEIKTSHSRLVINIKKWLGLDIIERAKTIRESVFLEIGREAPERT